MSSRMVCIADFEKHAISKLPKNALDYYRSGADEQITLKDNTEVFKRYKIRPRFLTNVSSRDLHTTILGHNISFPVCIAPTAMQRMAHPHGEVATARGAKSAGTGFTLSTIATCSIEEIQQGAEGGLHFFQLYIYRERGLTVQLVRRAERCGFKALLLTVDTPFFGKRRNDTRNKFKLPSHLKMANFQTTDFKSSGVSSAREGSGLNEYAASLFDPSLTWKDVEWLKTITKLPIVVKGILTAEDALEAARLGLAAVLVSNHGARQLDTVPATLDVLPEVVQAVAGRCEVYLDGGVRTGTDVLKALGLGARAVFIGRPALYGLTYNGQAGVEEVLAILKEEFSSAMALSGCSRISDIQPELVVHQSHYSRL